MFGTVRTPRVYEQIVAQIERAIYDGRLAHGDKLPPERQLVREFGASRVAVREALRALEHRGLVDVRQGSAGGYFKTGQYLTFDGKNPHNNLLVSLCNSMGVETNTFGMPEYCTGPLNGLT